MRKLLRSMAKAQMKKMGVDKINKRMSYWRKLIDAYPINIVTGEKMQEGYHGPKKQKRGNGGNHLFYYNWKFTETPRSRKFKWGAIHG